MKTRCLICLMVLFAWNALCAREYPALPIHPLSVYHSYNQPSFLKTIRIMADSISYIERGYINGEKGDGYAVYKRSKDGLTDSIYSESGISSLFIYHYSPEGKLLAMEDGALPFLTGTVFVYDTQGRLMSDTSFFNNQKRAFTTYTYKPDTVWIHSKDLTNPNNSSKRQISYQYTDNGYVEETIREWQQNDIFQIDTMENEYVFNTSNQLVRGGNNQYTYLEDGGYIRHYENESYRENEQFNDKGYPIKRWTDEYSNSSGGWVTPSFEWTAEYYYNSDYPNYNTVIELLTPQVYGVKDGIMVESEKPAWVHIYTIQGLLVQKRQVTIEKQWISLNHGVYVVTIGNKSYKVAV